MRPFPDKASRINTLEYLRHGNNTACNIVWLQALSRRIVECCSRSRNQGQGQVIRFHRYFWIWLLVLALDTCFWHNSLHNSTGAETGIFHDDVIKWKHFRVTAPLCGKFIGHWWIPLHESQWRGALMFSLICAWTNGCTNNRYTVDLRRHRPHYDVIVMSFRNISHINMFLNALKCKNLNKCYRRLGGNIYETLLLSNIQTLT